MTAIGTTPPQRAIDAAVAASKQSPCQKSQRGAAIYVDRPSPFDIIVTAANWNRPPKSFMCSGTESCRRDCNRTCSHAEQTAIASALVTEGGGYLAGYTLIHAKTINGELVSGGGPSCWQCSRLVVEVELEGVWLYEDVVDRVPADAPAGMQAWRPVHRDVWRYYTAAEFHRATLKACDLHNVEAVTR